jgi:hypothetical protein
MTTATVSEVRTTRDPLRRLAAWIAPVGPLAMAGWSLAVPYDLADPQEVFIAKMADDVRVELSFWAMLVFALTIGVGVVVTGLVARRGAPRLGTVGLVTAWLGFAAMGFAGIAYDALAAAPLRAGLDVETITGILAEADKFTAPMIGGIIFIPMSFLGTILLGIALWRTRAVPRWASAILIAAFPVILAGGAFLMAVNAFGFVMIAVAFGMAGRAFATPESRI